MTFRDPRSGVSYRVAWSRREQCPVLLCLMFPGDVWRGIYRFYVWTLEEVEGIFPITAKLERWQAV